MPTIYDNIEKDLLEGLKDALAVSQRGDFCVGYFNLRGWRLLADGVSKIKRQPDKPACRLIVGMHHGGGDDVKRIYSGNNADTTNKRVWQQKRHFAELLRQQLTMGMQNAPDEKGLRNLHKSLRDGTLQVQFFGAYPLHAKLYLAHRDDKLNPITAFVGSSNLTFAGLQKQGELNVDVQEKDAAQKLANWFEERWDDDWCLDITEELANILEDSWVLRKPTPYEIYIKTAYELSREAVDDAGKLPVPEIFRSEMPDFQKQAVSLAAYRLKTLGGVMISDAVGLGKTMVASAVVKTFQENRGGGNVLVICPPNLEGMWGDYLHKYEIAGKTMSLAKADALEDEKKAYKLVVIDESHNLRNSESKRHAQVAGYLSKYPNSRVVLLTATPYNKHFSDIASQLRLFVNKSDNLNIRPEQYIAEKNGETGFRSAHSDINPSSLEAFEKSDKVDDWRELMRMYMVRRTRSHIKKHYAEYDEERKRSYMVFPQGERRFYFPERKAKRAKFAMKENDPKDQYAALYSEDIADGVIGELALPRYGLKKYLLPQYQSAPLPGNLGGEGKVIRNLTFAGERMRGFARSGLFKRLESSGHAFLLSVRKHIVRNAVYLAALDDDGGKLPIGDLFGSVDDVVDSDDDEGLLPEEKSGEPGEFGKLLDEGKQIYRALKSGATNEKFDWIKTSRFQSNLRDKLRDDCQMLMRVFDKVPEWKPEEDRKLKKLLDLCKNRHKDEKLLIFTQFADTADYLHKALKDNGVQRIAKVTGDTGKEDLRDTVRSFSPKSNGAEAAGLNELRVLITTDTLSEGQNLQDAHIIVNFDLPWAIIRLIQRAGRVDRIGQEADDILCYCFLPEDGVNKIISLRSRLQARIKQNAELVGSDEVFFEGNTVNPEQVFNKEALAEKEQDDDTDLISRCHDIWRTAAKERPELEKSIPAMPNVVYSGKHARAQQKNGVLAYVKTGDNRHVLAHVGENGKVLTQSQSAILDMMACQPEEPRVKTPADHHDLVAVAARHARHAAGIGGQLGGPRSVRRRLYDRLDFLVTRQSSALFQDVALKQTIQGISEHPLQEGAERILGGQIKEGVSVDELAANAVRMHKQKELLKPAATSGDAKEVSIICSVALVNK